MATLGRAYLTVYNAAMCVGWIVVLTRVVLTATSQPPSSSVADTAAAAYMAASVALAVFQTGALMEVLHAVTGLVRASPVTTLVQVSSRLLLVWGVLVPVPDVRASPFLLSMVCAWSLTEIPRYAYFAYSVATGLPPFWLAWLRYSTFIPLYPIGASSEWILLLKALPFIRAREIYTVHMPNPANFAFDYYRVCISLLALYIPGLPYMFMHMMKQRSKHLRLAGAAAGIKVA